MRKGFTLAEVLITLGIIGVVAALVMPSLIADYRKKEYVTRLQKAVSVWGNGMKLMMATDGADFFDDTDFARSLSSNSGYYNALESCSYIDGTCMMDKADSILKKYFKIIKIENKFGVTGWKPLGEGPSMGVMDLKLLYMPDGTIYYVSLTNVDNSSFATKGDVFIDVNGKKPPNQWGRDVFGFVLNNRGQLEPFSYSCVGEEFSNGMGCAKYLMENGWVMDY
ncbi:MAG: type II secretion system GspH family protein [Heliobacteriaceae bacterium]|jgi:prepilin-type N-terminal cleavage/methylation domain-containing protein|nr:type II secretion system GspH family protein [Heliobacteriaceae bacterium]